MDPVFGYRAVSFRPLLLGRKPKDLLVALFTLILVFGITHSFTVTLLYLIFVLWFTRKIRGRPPGYVRSLMFFLILPGLYKVGGCDSIPLYKRPLDED